MLKLVGRVDRLREAHLPSAMFAVVLLFGSTGASLAQGGIGEARIVVNSVQGNLASGSSGPVTQGDSVYRDESVLTRVDSKAALLLEDQTNVTVGPSSTIKLDRFVYAGAAKPGTIALNLAKGTCRFVTGDATKRSYTILRRMPSLVFATDRVLWIQDSKPVSRWRQDRQGEARATAAWPLDDLDVLGRARHGQDALRCRG